MNADHGTFCWFLRWLVNHDIYGPLFVEDAAEYIIYVVEKRWKYQPEFEDFLDATADER